MSTDSRPVPGMRPAGSDALATLPLRIGIVPYLNVQPLVWAFSRAGIVSPPAQLHALTPRRLALALREGQFDAAIVPVFEYFCSPGYSIVPEFAIGSRGAVHSVVLFSRVPLVAIDEIRLDPASVTSVNLLRVLLAEKGLRPVLQTAPAGTVDEELVSPETARLLIGDPAMALRGRFPFEYDLGELWLELTGLPFVFAAWLVPPGAPEQEVSAALRQAGRAGLAALEQVASDTAAQFGFSPEAALDYFRNSIQYDLGEAEIAGIREFARLCAKHELIASPAPALRFCAG